MLSTDLTTSQIIFNLLVIMSSVLVVCYVISRSRVLPSLDNTNGRYAHIDGLRGLAALFVFMDHTPVIMEIIGTPTTHFHFANIRIPGGIGILGVQIFFCITAFLFTEKLINAKKEMDWGGFYTNRLRRLVPLYFFTVSVGIIFAALIKTQTPINVGHTIIAILKTYGFNFIPFQPIFGFNLYSMLGNIWSLAYEWRFYILMPVFFWWIKSGWKIPFIILLIIAILDLSASQQAAWPFFMGGVIAAFTVNRIKLQKEWQKWSCLALAIAIISIPLWHPTHYFGLLRWLTETTGFVLLMLAEPGFLKIRTLRFLGEISYSFYLLGITYAYIVFYVLIRTDDAANMSFNVYLFWQILTSMSFVVICTLTFRFIEYPFLRKKIILEKDKIMIPAFATN